jgi:hypothetical protein
MALPVSIGWPDNAAALAAAGGGSGVPLPLPILVDTVTGLPL